VKDLTQKLLITPWEIDQSLYTEYAKGRSNSSVLHAQLKTQGLASQPMGRKGVALATAPAENALVVQRKHAGLFSSCILGRKELLPSEELVNQLLPPEYRNNRRAIKMIKVSIFNFTEPKTVDKILTVLFQNLFSTFNVSGFCRTTKGNCFIRKSTTTKRL